MYVTSEEDAAMLYRPLFWTSFWCEDWLNSLNYRGAKTVAISSASSKTGFCLALAIKKRIKKTGNADMQVIGLTSASNLKFVQDLGLYDAVLLYDEVSKLDPSKGPYCYVDMAGNDSLNQTVVAQLGDSLSLGVILGMSHPPTSETKSIKATAETSPKFEMFFMPEWMHIVRQRVPVSEISKRQVEGWRWIMDDGREWVKMQKTYGSRDVVERISAMVQGRVGPDEGLVFSMWDGGKEGAKL